MSAASPDALAAETALLGRARRALRDGDPAAALAAIAAHSDAAPAGVLAEDRETLRVLALGAAGREPEARAVASALARRRPTSVHRARLRASCASEVVPDEPSETP